MEEGVCAGIAFPPHFGGETEIMGGDEILRWGRNLHPHGADPWGGNFVFLRHFPPTMEGKSADFGDISPPFVGGKWFWRIFGQNNGGEVKNRGGQFLVSLPSEDLVVADFSACPPIAMGGKCNPWIDPHPTTV